MRTLMLVGAVIKALHADSRSSAELMSRVREYPRIELPTIKEEPPPEPPRTPRPDRRAQREHNRRVGRMVTR